MEVSYEIKYHELEKDGWWFRARRDIILKFLSAARDAHILDIGCSGGALLRDLARAGFKNGYGIDVSERAIQQCKNAGFANVACVDARATGFPDNTFDVVIASDILEHIADENGALKEWRRIMKPSGIMFIFVPAHQYLWSNHDAANQHVKRYSRVALITSAQRNGLRVQRIGYWNFFLFFPTLGARLLQRVMRKKENSAKDQLYRLPALINEALFLLLKVENAAIARNLNVPIGVSLFCIGKK